MLREALLHAEEFDLPVYKRRTRGDADAAGGSGVGGKQASGSHGAGSSGNFTLGASMYNDDDGAESNPCSRCPSG